MTVRPTRLVVGAAVLALEGVAALGWAVVVTTVVLALGGGILAVAAAVIALGILFGAACLVAARGAWAGRMWSWPASVLLQALVLLSIAGAALSSG